MNKIGLKAGMEDPHGLVIGEATTDDLISREPTRGGRRILLRALLITRQSRGSSCFA
jgi:hypothetical protein